MATLLPTVTIAPIAGDDILDAAEHAAAVTVRGTTTGLGDGTALSLSLAGTTYAVTVTGGVWSVSVPAAAVARLSGGVSPYRVEALVTDAEGQTASAGRDLALDLTADAGALASLAVGITPDRIVNAVESVSVPFHVGGLDADATAVARFSDGTHVTEVAVGADGSYRADLSGFDGPVAATLRITDRAGNTASAAGNTILVDPKAPETYAPDGPGAPRVALAHDTGLPGDRITSDAALTILTDGTGAALVTLVDGRPVAAYDPAALADGAHTVSVTPLDAQGRALSAGTIAFTLDRAAPQVAIDGASGGTSAARHVLSGSVGAEDAGATVTIRDHGTVIGTATADTQGHWSLGLTAGDGPRHDYAFTATAIDAAGNAGASDVFDFALDFTANRTAFGAVSHDAGSAAGAIVTLYDALLDRAPDALGFEGWLDANLSPRELAARILASGEFQAEAGAGGRSDAGFVGHLYETALHREGGTAEIAHWTDLIAHGASRADVAVGIAFSVENRAGIESVFRAGVYVPDAEAAEVARLYHGLLERAPDAAGLAGFTAVLHGGGSVAGVAEAMLASREYGALHPTRPGDAAFVAGLYEEALGRAPDATGAAHWADALAHGAARGAVAAAIAESPEAALHLVGRIEAGWHLAA
ncbi:MULTISPECIES: DUF4214 domain-containing protein [Methylobacterium]|nr:MULTISPECIES: DUF4214 domain-containing protein [Methylobacterium]